MGFRLAAPVRSQRGSAIVFAMGLSLLVVGLSAALLMWLNLDMRRVEQLQAGTQRLGLLESSEAMAAARIMALAEGWELPWTIEVQGTQIRGQVHDLSGRFNVNALFTPEIPQNTPAALQPKAVLTRVLEDNGVQDAEGVIEAIASSHRILFGLGQVKGLEAAKQHLYAADPGISQININGTTPEVLSSVLDISQQLATVILMERPIETMNQLHEILKQHELVYDPPESIDLWLGLEGHYYVLETTIMMKRLVRVYSVFEKDEKSIKLLWRSWGTLP